MTLSSRIDDLSDEAAKQLLRVACIRIAFMRSHDPAYELTKLQEEFGFDEYRRMELNRGRRS